MRTKHYKARLKIPLNNSTLETTSIGSGIKTGTSCPKCNDNLDPSGRNMMNNFD